MDLTRQRMLWNLADERLVQQYLDKQDTPDNGEPERQELMHRYLKDIDTWVRAVLRDRGIAFTVSENYYNEVIFPIYEKILAPGTNVDTLRSYDCTRGAFKVWLHRVVINMVLDWIRAQFPGMQLVGYAEVSLDEKIDDGEESQNRYEIISANLAPRDIERQNQIRCAFCSLPSNYRVVLRLLMIAYDELPEEDMQQIVEDIVKRTGEDTQVVEARQRKKLRSLRERLRASDAFSDGERLELELAVLMFKVEYYKRLVSESEKQLLRHFGVLAQNLSEIWEKPQVLKDIELECQVIEKKYQEHEIDRAEYEKASCILDYKKCCARLTNARKRWCSRLEQRRSGKYIVMPTQQEIASVYERPLGTIGSWISRGKAKLAVCLAEKNGKC